MSPEVSVLIPLYNNEAYIGSAVESVLSQTFKDYEIILCDDGSSDNGFEVASSYPQIKAFRHEHAGIAKTRNFLLSKACGKFIAFLDSDDLWTPDKLELQAAYLNAHPECGIVFCSYRGITDIPEEQLSGRQKEIMSVALPNCLIPALIRKELFEKYGTFNEGYRYSEDTEWLMRMKMSHEDLSHRLDKVLYLRRIHENNITLTHSENMDERERYSIMAHALISKLRNKHE